MKTSGSLFLERHGKKIEAALGCYDRLVITGTLLDQMMQCVFQRPGGELIFQSQRHHQTLPVIIRLESGHESA
jgi:hypothetical protein